MKQRTVYFARGVDGLNIDEVLGQGDDLAITALQKWDLTLVDPVRRLRELDFQGISPSQIVRHDLNILRRCDAFLADLSESSRIYVGCISELTYAYLWGIPTTVVVADADLAERSWLKYHAGSIWLTLEEGFSAVSAALDDKISLGDDYDRENNG